MIEQLGCSKMVGLPRSGQSHAIFCRSPSYEISFQLLTRSVDRSSQVVAYFRQIRSRILNCGLGYMLCLLKDLRVVFLGKTCTACVSPINTLLSVRRLLQSLRFVTNEQSNMPPHRKIFADLIVLLLLVLPYVNGYWIFGGSKPLVTTR